MKQVIAAFFLLMPTYLYAQSSSTNSPVKPATDTLPKSKEFKSGEYTMKQYYFVMLTRGKRRGEITDTAQIRKLQEGHMANINRLAAMGKIIVAGPFGDDSDWRGIFIFDSPSKEEVEELLQTDPAIAAGRLGYEIHPWWTAKNAVFK